MSVIIYKITELAEFDRHVSALSELLLDTVKSGASVGFIEPFSLHNSTDFWLNSIRPHLLKQNRSLFIALQEGKLVGAVQLIVDMPSNQAHRCEIAKMMVHSQSRRQGIGRKLMHKCLELALSLDKGLVTLDTRSGDPSQTLYQSMGFEVAGEIPHFAKDPDSDKISPTTYMYKFL